MKFDFWLVLIITLAIGLTSYGVVLLTHSRSDMKQNIIESKLSGYVAPIADGEIHYIEEFHDGMKFGVWIYVRGSHSSIQVANLTRDSLQCYQ